MAEKAPLTRAPYEPVPFEPFDVGSLQALQRGEADEAQQIRALKFIVEQLCGAYDLSYRPSSAGDTAFAEGRRFVGLQLIKLLKLDYSEIRKNHGRPTGRRDER